MIYDVAIVGAGAAGLAAARRLRFSALRAIVLEARDRLGGRAHTITHAPSLALDLGCEWLHSADRNPLVPLAKELGFGVDSTLPRWGEQAGNRGFPVADQRAFQTALQRFEDRIADAARTDHDEPAANYFDPACRWNPLINAFSSYYNGVAFEHVSILDYAAYDDSGVNWRIPQGLGTMIAALGAGCEIALGSPVTDIDHSGPMLRLHTAKGPVEGRTAIVTVPTSLIATERLRFHPALPAKIAAAAGLPLGLADKLFLAVKNAALMPQNSHAFGRADRAETGSYLFRPAGQPYIECFFGGETARSLEEEGPGGFVVFALEELSNLFGSAVRGALHPLATTSWGMDPFAAGSYSYARPGHHGDRARLGEAVDGRLFFAGEACSERSFSTAHGAYETGVRAAEEAMAAIRV